MDNKRLSQTSVFNTWDILNTPDVKENKSPMLATIDNKAELCPTLSPRRPSSLHKITTFDEAVEKEDAMAFERLLEENPGGVDERSDFLGEALIHKLCLRGNENHNVMIKMLVKKFPYTLTQTCTGTELKGATALHISIIRRNAEIVEWLLSDEHDLIYREQQLTAVVVGDFFQLGRPCYYGQTPLAFACCTNQWNLVELLIKYDASMNAVDSYGNSLLHLLVIHSLPDMYIKFKKEWIEKHKYTQPQIDDTEDDGKDNDSELGEYTDVPPWKTMNKDGYTPLTLAAKLGLYKMFSFLLDEDKIVQWSFGPVSCVLYPLNQVDLDFEDEKGGNRRTSALEIIVQNALVKLIMHPRMVDLVDKKWERFAQRIFFQRFFVGLCYFTIFLITTILDQVRIEHTQGEDDEEIITAVEPPGMLCQGLCTIGRFLVLAGALNKGWSEWQEMCKVGYKKYFQTTGSGLLENCLSSLFCLTIVLVNIARLFNSDIESALLAIASIFGWGYMLFFVMAFQVTGPFIVMIYQMLFNDVLRFFIIYSVFLIGFSQAFYVLLGYNGFSGFIVSLKESFLGLLGDFDLDTYVECRFSFISVSLLIIYIIVVTILLLNLLVAMMGDTYGKIIDDATEVWQLERARIVFAIENEMETEERNLESNKYWTNVKGKRYLQVEEVKEGWYNTAKQENTNADDGDADAEDN